MIIKLLVAEENEDTSSYSGITVFLAFGAGCFVKICIRINNCKIKII
jgi:hypothetical protein